MLIKNLRRQPKLNKKFVYNWIIVKPTELKFVFIVAERNPKHIVNMNQKFKLATTWLAPSNVLQKTLQSSQKSSTVLIQ